MRNKIILLLTLLLFTTSSCSTTPRIISKKDGINPEFIPYIVEYRYLIGKDNTKYNYRLGRLDMNFAKLEGTVIGRCHWLIGGGYEIEIDEDWWKRNRFNFISKQFLVWHELEHCIRYRMHTNKKKEIKNISDFFETIAYYIGIIKDISRLKDGCPASIMHSHQFDYSCEQKHYEYYLDEIRNWNK